MRRKKSVNFKCASIHAKGPNAQSQDVSNRAARRKFLSKMRWAEITYALPPVDLRAVCLVLAMVSVSASVLKLIPNLTLARSLLYAHGHAQTHAHANFRSFQLSVQKCMGLE